MSKEQEAVVELGLTKAVRMPWANLHEAKRFKDPQGRENGEPKYSATFLIPNEGHDDLKAHKLAVTNLLKVKYGDRLLIENGKAYITERVDGDEVKTRLKLPFSSGDDMMMQAMEKDRDRSFCAGHTVLKSSSQYPVACFDAGRRDKNGEPIHVAEPDAIKETFYGGCYVAAQVKYRTYDRVGQSAPGVTAYLQKVCFVQKGERIAAGVSGDVFKSVQGAVVNESMTGAGSGDEMSL